MSRHSVSPFRRIRPLDSGCAATWAALLGVLVALPSGANAVEDLVVQAESSIGVPSIELKLYGTTAPGVVLSYAPVPGTSTNAALFQLPLQQDVWQWQSKDTSGERLQMSLKADNSLELVNGAGTTKIVLKPGATATSVPEITIDGAPVLTATTGLTRAVANAAYAPIAPSIFTVGPNTISGGVYGFAAGGYNEIHAESAIALGERNWINGKWGFAAGMQNQVQAEAAGAIGYQNMASGWGSFAAGVNASATGSNSIALGRGPKSSGDYSFAAGYGSIASGSNASAIGASVEASGIYSAALGIATKASGDYTTALGGWTKSTVYASLAAGAFTEANGWASTSLGYYTRANGANQLVAGYFNIPQGNPYTPAPADDLFIIGNGSDDFHRSNAFVVKRNGDTEISGSLKVNGVLRVAPAGDISMDGFEVSPLP